MTLRLRRPPLFDVLLAGLAVLGFGLFALALPTQHPDAAADYDLGEEGAVEAAAQFLAQNGYETAELAPHAAFRRLPALLDSLQQDLGRPAAIAALEGESGERLPGYYWRAVWEREERGSDAGGEGESDPSDSVFAVSLNKTGEVWGFWVFPGAYEPLDVDRMALHRVLAGTTDGARDESSLPPELSDSTLSASLSFAAADSLWGGTPVAEQRTFERGMILVGLMESARIPVQYLLGSDWAVALARHHLSRTALASYSFRVDSTWLVQPVGARTGLQMAAVRFTSVAPYQGQTVQTDVRVTATGTLAGIDTRFNTEPKRTVTLIGGSRGEEPNEAEGSANFSVTARNVAGILAVLTYAVLVIIFLFLFFRRLNAHLIDARAALRDAFWGGLFAGVMMALSVSSELVRETPDLWQGLLMAAAGGLFVAVGGALPILFVSSTADSITRESWPEKLDTWSLMRQASFRNVPVGLAQLRGVAIAGVMLGLITLGLAVLPRVVLHPRSENAEAFFHDEALSPLGYLFSYHAYGSLFMSLLVLLGAGTLFYRWKAHPAVVIPGVALLLVLIQAGPLEVDPLGYQWMFAGIIAVVLAVAFWRYDALTCFFGYLFLNVLWNTAPGWLVEGLPEQIDAVLAFALVVLVLGFGVAGVLSGRTGAELPRYVPAYIEDLTHRERLKRELEIAHLVQESFLPRRMPKLEGLDIAAMCLAAQEVGGDYYDFIEIEPGRLAVVVGDVSGKGIQAAFYMTLTKGFLQTLCRSVDSPAEVLRRLNALFCENAPRGTFISLIYGVVDVAARTFTFARAGHNPVILKRSPSQQSDLVQPDGMAVGLIPGERFDSTIAEVTLHLRPGDVLVFYTDGFSEAMNAAKERYGDQRLARKVGDVGQRSASEILRAVSEDVHHFVEAVGRHDDMTMVVIKLSRRTDYLSAVTAHREAARA